MEGKKSGFGIVTGTTFRVAMAELALKQNNLVNAKILLAEAREDITWRLTINRAYLVNTTPEERKRVAKETKALEKLLNTVQEIEQKIKAEIAKQRSYFSCIVC